LENEELYFTISTAGHVDHGKTSVLKRLTGIDTDRLKEEKQRQMTTDLGFAYLRLSAPASLSPKAKALAVGFIDVPGHGKFLKNMIAGVGALDLALLIVAADEGPMPQTIQHLEILNLLEVKNIIAVITKCDLVDEQRIQDTTQLTLSLLEEYGQELLAVVPVSCTSGFGFD